MRYIILPIILILSLSASAQNWLEDKENLKGDVKFLHIESGMFNGDSIYSPWRYDTFQYNPQGYLVRSFRSNWKYSNYNNGFFRTYNAEGTLCEVDYYLNDGDTTSRCYFEYDSLNRATIGIYHSGKSHWSTFNYLYNESGLLKEYFAVIKRDGDTIRNVYTYDDMHRKIKDHHISNNRYDSQEITTWQFDENGNILVEKMLDLNPGSKTIITTEADGTRHIEKREPTGKYGEDSYIIKFKYNKAGQAINEVKTNLDGIVEYDISYTYNKQGDAKTENYAKTDKREASVVINEYVYDHKGNWVSKISSWNGEPDFKATRTIEYY